MIWSHRQAHGKVFSAANPEISWKYSDTTVAGIIKSLISSFWGSHRVANGKERDHRMRALRQAPPPDGPLPKIGNFPMALVDSDPSSHTLSHLIYPVLTSNFVFDSHSPPSPLAASPAEATRVNFCRSAKMSLSGGQDGGCRLLLLNNYIWVSKVPPGGLDGFYSNVIRLSDCRRRR